MGNHATVVRELIARLADDGMWPADVVMTAQRHGALPAVADMGGCLALTPSGEVVMWTWDEPTSVTAVSDPRLAHAVAFQAARKYPPLESFGPVRGADATECPSCRGSGRVQGLPEDVGPSIICWCGGSGWLPPGVGGP